MADLGHYEFGALHRPLDFAGFREWAGDLKPGSIDYWLAYWIAAFQHVEEHREVVTLVSYDRLTASGLKAWTTLCKHTRIDVSDSGTGIGKLFRPAVRYDRWYEEMSPELARGASELHDRLLERSTV